MQGMLDFSVTNNSIFPCILQWLKLILHLITEWPWLIILHYYSGYTSSKWLDRIFNLSLKLTRFGCGWILIRHVVALTKFTMYVLTVLSASCSSSSAATKNVIFFVKKLFCNENEMQCFIILIAICIIKNSLIYLKTTISHKKPKFKPLGLEFSNTRRK